MPEPDKVYNEESWTDPESQTLDFYTKSKAVAEKAAWDFVKELPGWWYPSHFYGSASGGRMLQ